MIQGGKDAIRKLDELPGDHLPNPIVLYAIMTRETSKGGERWYLSIHWLESGFDVHGFYLVDSDGKTFEAPNSLHTDKVDIAYYRDGLWRMDWATIIHDPADETWSGLWAFDKPAPAPVCLPRLDYSKGDVRAGLLTSTGRTQPVTVGFRPLDEDDVKRKKTGEGLFDEIARKRSK